MGITGKQRGRHIFADGVGGGARPYAADGVLSPSGGTHFLTKAGIGAYVLGAPASDGIHINVVSRTAFAHVVTATGLLDDGTAVASKNTGTFAAFPGASFSAVSGGGKWNVLTKGGVTVA